MVIEVLAAARSMPSKSARMSPRCATGTPTRPTSPRGQLVRRGRSRSGWAGRRRPTGRSGPWPGCAGTARWSRRRTSGRRRCASPRAGRARAASAVHAPEFKLPFSRPVTGEVNAGTHAYATGRRMPSSAHDVGAMDDELRSRCAGCARRTAARPRSTGVDLDGATGARCSRCSGPNGAGKTTTVEILEGYRRRDAGEVTRPRRRPGRTPTRAWRARVGIVLQGTGEFDELTVARGGAPLRRLLPRAGRPGRGDRAGRARPRRRGARTHTLSGGQKRRLDVALGIVGRPELLFLDEPTTGFDPEARREFWELIRDLAGGRHHDPADHALPGRGRGARRPGRRDRRRPADRGGHPGRAGRPGRARRRRSPGVRPDGACERAQTDDADRVRGRAGRALRRRGPRPHRDPAHPGGRLPHDDRTPA